MYIPEFFCGVIATILFEIFVCIMASVLSPIVKGKGGESNADKNDPVNTSTYDRNGKWNDSES